MVLFDHIAKEKAEQLDKNSFQSISRCPPFVGVENCSAYVGVEDIGVIYVTLDGHVRRSQRVIIREPDFQV